MKFYPTCKYCGQKQFISDDYDSQIEANEHAALNCGCHEARIYREEQKRKEKREENVNLIKDSIEGFKNFCALRNAELTDERKDITFNAAVAVLDDVMRSAALAFSNVKIAIKKTSKDKIELKFICTDSMAAEV